MVVRGDHRFADPEPLKVMLVAAAIARRWTAVIHTGHVSSRVRRRPYVKHKSVQYRMSIFHRFGWVGSGHCMSGLVAAAAFPNVPCVK